MKNESQTLGLESPVGDSRQKKVKKLATMERCGGKYIFEKLSTSIIYFWIICQLEVIEANCKTVRLF